ncbi:MAG: 2-hydroxyacyl-CoA dehydratase family protein [Candidatus Hermodarchaeota archaeon]
MSLIADEIIQFSSVLRMAYNLLTGRNYLKRKKFREKEKLVAVTLPFSDLAFAAGTIPVFPIRMHQFEISQYLTYLGSASSIFGWNTVSNFLGFIKNLGINEISKIVDDIIEDVIDVINKKYNEMYDIGIENGISSDFCYGLKSLVGMHVSKGSNVDACLNITIRCSAFNKYLESLKAINQEPKQIWVDIPPRNIGNAIELLTDNVSNAIREFENLTGNTITDNQIREHFKIGNQVKRSYKNIIYDISASDFYPCNPATFSEIMALLSISYQDYNSNATRYRDNIVALEREMRERIRKGIGMDVSNRPRIFVTPMFGGWEPKSHEIIYELGGRALYADWELLKLLEEIPTSSHSNPAEEYARFLMNATETGIGCDNDKLTDSYLRMAKKLDADGLIFFQLFGCHSISNCYATLREKVRRELEIPTIAITFNKIGENVEQVKTRLGAFMEMFP